MKCWSWFVELSLSNLHLNTKYTSISESIASIILTYPCFNNLHYPILALASINFGCPHISTKVASSTRRTIELLAKDANEKHRTSTFKQQDCCLFAVAFATNLCMRKDPHTERYTQPMMRDHLARCLDEKRIADFPHPEGRKRLGRQNY